MILNAVDRTLVLGAAALVSISLHSIMQQQLHVHALQSRTAGSLVDHYLAENFVPGFEVSTVTSWTSITRGAAWENEFVRFVHGRVEFAPDPQVTHNASQLRCFGGASFLIESLTERHAEGLRGDTMYMVHHSNERDTCLPISTPVAACASIVALVQCVQGCRTNGHMVTTCWRVREKDNFATRVAQESRCIIEHSRHC
ncbi:hypothetical protein BKA62DRAFT_720028 [Auriculariales sp. MPI-PUGE-AT-0066]|nr:hypothetical protein BKA62DRAFT_720028 [Auriculariales sp. MPI-PUGE-AT-0066]